MSFQLDTLTDNKGVCVIYNSVDGEVREFDCSVESLLDQIGHNWPKRFFAAEAVSKRFSREEIETFLENPWVQENKDSEANAKDKEELDKIFGK